MNASLTAPSPPPRIPRPFAWPDYPLLALRGTADDGSEIHGVLVDGGGFTVIRATVAEARSIDMSADLTASWSFALMRRFRYDRYESAPALFAAGWRVAS